MAAAETSGRWESEQGKAAPAGGTLQRCQEWIFPLLWGHQTAAAAVLSRVEPLVLHPPLCPASSLLPCFLASEKPPRWGIRAGPGQSSSVCPCQPLGPENLSPDAKVH